MVRAMHESHEAPLYHEGSINPTAVLEGEANPYYQRGLGDYELEFNNLNPDGEPLFSIEDWKDKSLLDIGAGGHDRFGMEARAQGVRVTSLNPALKDESKRTTLKDAVTEQNEAFERESHEHNLSLPIWKRVIQKKRKHVTLESESVAALGQSLPFKDESFDAIVSVYGVPHYLHHVDASLSGAEAIAAYTPEIREEDQALMEVAFTDMLRVLKPGGKAFLKDDHRKPGQTEYASSSYSPSDGQEVIEVLEALPGVKVEIYEQDMPLRSTLGNRSLTDYSRVGGVQRCIVLTKLDPSETKPAIVSTEYPMSYQ